MKRWLWFFLSLFISTSVYFTIRYGLRPKPIPVMNASEFEQPPQIGAVIYRRLVEEIRSEHLLLLGSDMNLADSGQLWTGLLKTARADHAEIPVIFQREGLPSVEGDGVPIIPYSEQMVASGDLVKMIKAKIQPGQLVIVHGTTDEVSHLHPESLSRILDKELERPVLALSTVNATLSPEEQERLMKQCYASKKEAAARIDCSQVRESRLLGKRKSGKIWASMERHGLKEYLVFVHN
jgi:hypothetical protein